MKKFDLIVLGWMILLTTSHGVTAQSSEYVEDDIRPDAILKTVAHKEFLIGNWEEVDGTPLYGTIRVEKSSISWGKCKSQYSISLISISKGTYPDKLEFEYPQATRYVTLKLKLESGTCDGKLGFLQFSIDPNNPEVAKVIEYGKDNKPKGWMNFIKH